MVALPFFRAWILNNSMKITLLKDARYMHEERKKNESFDVEDWIAVQWIKLGIAKEYKHVKTTKSKKSQSSTDELGG